MIAVAAWGSAPQGYRIYCRPEGTKAVAICNVVKEGRLWNLDSGEYLNAEGSYPGWGESLGSECAGRYRDYYTTLEARMNDDNGSRTEAEGVHFVCHNSVSN